MNRERKRKLLCEVALQLNVVMEFAESRRRLGEVAARGSHLGYCLIIWVSECCDELVEFEKSIRREVRDN